MSAAKDTHAGAPSALCASRLRIRRPTDDFAAGRAARARKQRALRAGQSSGTSWRSNDGAAFEPAVSAPSPGIVANFALWLGCVFCLATPLGVSAGSAVNARAIVERAIELTRSSGSSGSMTMLVNRPDWQRTSSLQAWTRGREDALIRFTAPAKDAGNATLKRGREMWTFAPRVNRVIRLPASLMSQSWAGSDYSYNDLARSDDLLVNYELHLVTEQALRDAGAAHIVYTIDARPRAGAPVVWGHQQLRIRDDGIVLETTFFDQAGAPVKRMQTMQIGSMGGRTIALRSRMVDLAEPAHYTEISYQRMQFDLTLSDAQFTQFALRNPQ